MQAPLNTLQRIEEAALNAWPALSTLLYDGWVMRLANGYTKRANSVTPLYAGAINLEEKIDHCEAFYQRQNLQPIFRLPTFLDIQNLDHQLAEKNYQLIDKTQVQILDLKNETYNFSPAAVVLEGEAGIRSWLNTFHRLNKQRKDDQTHEKMLNKITGRVGTMTITIGDDIVACGLGVVEGPYLGLFDIVTDKGQRRKGYAAMLTHSMLSWGQGFGAQTAYLQVMENNEPARRLYAAIGFQEGYRYWYRLAP